MCLMKSFFQDKIAKNSGQNEFQTRENKIYVKKINKSIF